MRLSLMFWPKVFHEFHPMGGVAAITPGADFGDNAPERHVRFAYTNSIEKLQEGVARIADFLGRGSR